MLIETPVVRRAAYQAGYIVRASHYFRFFHNQKDGAGQELLKESGKFFGANYPRPANKVCT
jgi:hypothetical protein